MPLTVTLTFDIYEPRLAMHCLLCGVEDDTVLWLGILCSSFTQINQHTSGRSFLTPLGDESRAYVRQGNILVSRCLGSTFSYDHSSFLIL